MPMEAFTDGYIIAKLQTLTKKILPDSDNIVRRRSKGSVEPAHLLPYVFSITAKLCQNEEILVIHSVRIALLVINGVSKQELPQKAVAIEKVLELIHTELQRLLSLSGEGKCPDWLTVSVISPPSLLKESHHPLQVELEWHSIINLRHAQEDRVIVIPDLRELLGSKLLAVAEDVDGPLSFTSSSSVSSAISLIAVFDGHKGSEAAEHCSRILPTVLTRCLLYFNGNVPSALGECLYQLNQSLHKYQKQNRWSSGTTATICVIKSNIVYTAWLGDCQAWLALRNGDIVALTDMLHRPEYAVEQLAVEELGGSVTHSADNHVEDSPNHTAERRKSGSFCRVSGVLAVSRSLGDDVLIRGVSPLPSITAYRLCSPDNAPPLGLIVASDGLWDTDDCHGEAVCDIVHQKIHEVEESALSVSTTELMKLKIPSRLCEVAAIKGSSDNTTVTCAWFSPLSSVDLLKLSAQSEMDLENVKTVLWPRRRHRSVHSRRHLHKGYDAMHIVNSQPGRSKSHHRPSGFHNMRFSSPMRTVTPE